MIIGEEGGEGGGAGRILTFSSSRKRYINNIMCNGFIVFKQMEILIKSFIVELLCLSMYSIMHALMIVITLKSFFMEV